MGLAPWKVNIAKIFEQDNYKNKLVILNIASNYGYLINILYIIVILLYITIILELNLWTLEIELQFSKIVEKSLIIFGCINVITVWIINILREKLIAKIINEIKIIDNILKICKHYNFENNFSMNAMFLVNFLFSNFSICLSLFINLSITSPIWISASALCTWVLTQYALLLNTIYQRFKNINVMIIELGNINTEIELKTLFVTKSHLSHSITADFFNITHVNMKLCDICNKLSDFYAIPTLLAIIYFIASCTFYLYVLYISLTNDAQKFPCILVHILFAMSFFKITSNFIVLITCTARIKREVNSMLKCVE